MLTWTVVSWSFELVMTGFIVLELLVVSADRGIRNERVISPIPVRPERSLKRNEAISQIFSFSTSSLIQSSGLETIRVRYWGTPFELTFGFGWAVDLSHD